MAKENNIEQFAALNLPKEHADALNSALGGLSVVMHRIGASPSDEVILSSLILDYIAEIRAR